MTDKYVKIAMSMNPYVDDMTDIVLEAAFSPSSGYEVRMLYDLRKRAVHIEEALAMILRWQKTGSIVAELVNVPEHDSINFKMWDLYAIFKSRTMPQVEEVSEYFKKNGGWDESQIPPREIEKLLNNLEKLLKEA